jgi:TetR/AcrR family transcriptional regulator, tetracycline repressor protein
MAGGKQQRLSRELILQVALESVDEDGLEALSMRRLAQKLDVWPMSIYRYFRDKDELLDAVAESAAEGLTVPANRASWRNQMRQLLHEARRVLGADAGGLATRLPRAILSPGLLKLSEAGLTILDRAGFDREEAARAWRAILSYTFGFTATAVAGDAERLTRAAIASLPEDEYPALSAAANELAAALAAEEEFDHGLDSLLDGLMRAASSPERTAGS